MSPENPESQAQEAVQEPLMRRIGLSLLLFTSVFVLLLFASWLFLLPNLTTLRLQGTTVDISVVIPFEQNLKAQIAEAEAQRSHIVLPITDTDYDLLKRQAMCFPMLETLTRSIEETARDMGENTVVFSGFAFDAKGTLVLTGDVRNVGPRSMTVLADFTERLGKLPFILSIVPPAFGRETAPGIGPHSPFILSLTLSASADCPPAS